MYIDQNLIYIKPCKLVLILSIHENQDRLNENQNMKLVCVYCELEHINTI